ncbi:hypothetical protein Tco_0804905, partial [Tanacetum coccineum]
TMEILPESTSNSSVIDASVMRMASASVKPCQGDSFEFYLITVAASSPCRVKIDKDKYMMKAQNIKLKIKIHDHKHAKGTSKEFPSLQGFETQDVTRSEAICAMTTP